MGVFLILALALGVSQMDFEAKPHIQIADSEPAQSALIVKANRGRHGYLIADLSTPPVERCYTVTENTPDGNNSVEVCDIEEVE